MPSDELERVIAAQPPEMAKLTRAVLMVEALKRSHPKLNPKARRKVVIKQR